MPPEHEHEHEHENNTHNNNNNDMPFLPPLTRTIAHYERIEQIGEGTYGQVYKARILREEEEKEKEDSRFDLHPPNKSSASSSKSLRTNVDLVALKKIRPITNTQDSTKTAMKAEVYAGLPLTAIREIKILKELRHPNMVQLIEVVTSKGAEDLDNDNGPVDDTNEDDSYTCAELKHLKACGNLFLVLEYVPMDLTGLMDMSFRFNEVQAKCVFRQLLQVLAYIHENKYVHRDLKCSNILIDWNFRLKLADFGLARSIRYEPMYANSSAAPDNGPSSTDENGLPNYTNKVITLWYRPPELLLGTTRYGTAVDMWSAGCILAELILGRPILPGKSEIEQLKLIFDLLGSPDNPSNGWDVESLPLVKSKKMEVAENKIGNLRKRFPDPKIPKNAMDLIEKLLTLDPRKRMSAKGALASRYFIMDPKAPDDPAELGRIEIEGKNESDNFHEFQTKKIRKEAKVIAEAAKKAAAKQGMSKTEIEDHYHEIYKHHMLTTSKADSRPSKKNEEKVKSETSHRRAKDKGEVNKIYEKDKNTHPNHSKRSKNELLPLHKKEREVREDNKRASKSRIERNPDSLEKKVTEKSRKRSINDDRASRHDHRDSSSLHERKRSRSNSRVRRARGNSPPRSVIPPITHRSRSPPIRRRSRSPVVRNLRRSRSRSPPRYMREHLPLMDHPPLPQSRGREIIDRWPRDHAPLPDDWPGPPMGYRDTAMDRYGPLPSDIRRNDIRLEEEFRRRRQDEEEWQRRRLLEEKRIGRGDRSREFNGSRGRGRDRR